MTRLTAEQRFWRKVDKAGPVPVHAPELGPCWLWTAGVSDGYGNIRAAGRLIKAHRFAYELLVGRVPQGLTLDHLCRVRRCVRPAHLEAVTNRVNVLRGVGAPAIHARATHCIRGHELVGTNLCASNEGRRRCRTCVRAAQKLAKREKRARERAAR